MSFSPDLSRKPPSAGLGRNLLTPEERLADAGILDTVAGQYDMGAARRYAFG
jgi:hypothetical protein